MPRVVLTAFMLTVLALPNVGIAVAQSVAAAVESTNVKIRNNTPEQVELQAQSDPHGAFEAAETMLATLPVDSELRPRWEAIASETAYWLVLPEPAKRHAQAGLHVVKGLGPELRQRLTIALAQSADISGEQNEGVKTLTTVIATLESGNFPSWLMVEALTSRGSMYGTLADFRAALADLLRAYALAQPGVVRGRRDDVAAILGNIYRAMHDYEHAEQYYREAIAGATQSRSLVRMSIAEYSLAESLRRSGHQNEAEPFFMASRDHSKQVGDVQGVAYAEYGLGQIALNQKHYDQAERYFRSALPTLAAAHDAIPQSGIALGLSEIAAYRKQYEMAFAQARSAIKLAEKSDERERQVFAIDWLARLYVITGDYRQAYDNEVLARQLKEKILESAREQSVAEMSVRFDSDRQKQENELLSKKNELNVVQLSEQKQRTRFYYAAVAFLLSLVGFLVYGSYKNKQLRNHLSNLAHTDVLTGIGNRRRVMELLQQEFSRARRYRFPLSIAMIDLDHFKSVNDQFGHDAGDEVLIEFSKMVRHHLRLTDAFGRLGGEEFIIVFPHTAAGEAVMVTDRLREAMASLTCAKLRGQQQPTFSAGVALQMPDDANVDALIKRADEAVYSAKNNGRNCVVLA